VLDFLFKYSNQVLEEKQYLFGLSVLLLSYNDVLENKIPLYSDFRGGFSYFTEKLPFESRKGNGNKECEASLSEHK
jgi:hypothetical protein